VRLDGEWIDLPDEATTTIATESRPFIG